MEKFLYFIAMFIITSYFSSKKFRPHILYKNFKRRRIIKSNYIDSDKIVYGVPHYDFFDHESRAYLSDLISIEYDDRNLYSYDFSISFENNCEIFPKMKEIKTFIENTPSLNQLCLDDIIKNELIDKISNNKKETVIVNKIFKGRKDEKNEMEAGILKIELIKSDYRTLSLIEELYKYLAELNPDVIELNFKTNNDKYIQKRDRYDVTCFLTKLKISGFVLNVKANTVAFVVDKNTNFSFCIDIDNQLVNKFSINNKMSGENIKLVVEEYINRCYRLNNNGKTKFTDVAISYLDGVNLELLGCTIFDDIILNDVDTVEITDSYEQFRKMIDMEDGCYKKEFSYLYMWSLNRKIKHNHL